uniref:uncharacterized protein n=1 Tax=Myxine glutinosa TaxID=7769 RepID=UPI00358E28AE
MSNINPCPSNSTWDQNYGLGFGLVPSGPFYHSRPAPPCASISIIFPCVMLSAGLSGNILAFTTVYRSYRQPESQRKRPFLVLVGALALTDLTGQLITAPLVIAVYAVGRRWSTIDPTGVLCQFFGACMTTFGLIPLFLAALMALERATAVRRPLVYVRRPPSPSQAGHAVVVVWLVTVSLACGPFFLGGYGLQWPGTWCFVRTTALEHVQLYPAGIFVSLALVSLFTTGACNAVTAHGLLSRKLCLRTVMERRSSGGTGTDASRFAIEPAAHLLGIMAVLGVCWFPLLVAGNCANCAATLSIQTMPLKYRDNKKTYMPHNDYQLWNSKQLTELTCKPTTFKNIPMSYLIRIMKGPEDCTSKSGQGCKLTHVGLDGRFEATKGCYKMYNYWDVGSGSAAADPQEKVTTMRPIGIHCPRKPPPGKLTPQGTSQAPSRWQKGPDHNITWGTLDLGTHAQAKAADLPHTSDTRNYRRIHETEHRTKQMRQICSLFHEPRLSIQKKKIQPLSLASLPGALWEPGTSQQWLLIYLCIRRDFATEGISSSPWMPTYEIQGGLEVCTLASELSSLGPRLEVKLGIQSASIICLVEEGRTELGFKLVVVRGGCSMLRTLGWHSDLTEGRQSYIKDLDFNLLIIQDSCFTHFLTKEITSCNCVPAVSVISLVAVRLTNHLLWCTLDKWAVMIKEITENLLHHAPSTLGCNGVTNISSIHDVNISKEVMLNTTLPSAATMTTMTGIDNLNRCRFYLPAIRLASLNQILDPWVYLLFRNIVVRRVRRVIRCCCHCGLAQSRLTPPGSTGVEDLRSGED